MARLLLYSSDNCPLSFLLSFFFSVFIFSLLKLLSLKKALTSFTGCVFIFIIENLPFWLWCNFAVHQCAPRMNLLLLHNTHTSFLSFLYIFSVVVSSVIVIVVVGWFLCVCGRRRHVWLESHNITTGRDIATQLTGIFIAFWKPAQNSKQEEIQPTTKLLKMRPKEIKRSWMTFRVNLSWCV